MPQGKSEMNRFRAGLAVLVPCVFAPSITLAADGDIDTAFPPSTAFFDLANGQLYDFGLGSYPMANGKVFTIGVVDPDVNDFRQIGCARFNANGTLDTSYDTDGRKTLVVPFAEVFGMETIGEQMTVIYGIAEDPGAGALVPNRAFGVARITPDCTLVPTFGVNGVRKVQFDFVEDGEDIARGAYITPDGSRIYVVGDVERSGIDRDWGVASLDGSGNFTSFSGDGKVAVAFDADALARADVAYAVTMRNNKLVVVGNAGRADGTTDAAVAVLDATTGALDTTFCPGTTCPDSATGVNSGRRTMTFNINGATANESDARVTFESGGDVYVSTTAKLTTTSQEFTVFARFNPNGTYDTNFGSNGAVAHFLRTNTRTVFLSQDGDDLIAAGSTATAAFNAVDPGMAWFVMRLHNGFGDSSFATTTCPQAGFTHCSFVEFQHQSGQPTLNYLSHGIRDGSKVLMTGSRLFRRATGVEDFDFAVARTKGAFSFANGFE